MWAPQWHCFSLKKLFKFNHEILDWNFDKSDNENDDYISDQGYVSGYE